MAQDAKSSESSAYEGNYRAFSHPVKECFACWRYARKYESSALEVVVRLAFPIHICS